MTIRLTAAIFAFAAFSALAPAFAQTPYLVADLNTTTPDGYLSSDPNQFQVFGDTLFFSAKTDSHGRELWKYTAADGASMVADIRTGGSSLPEWLTDIGGGVFLFQATDLTHGPALWRTDGTEAGTWLVKDIDPSTVGYSSFTPTASFGGKLYFVANDGVHGWEPWFSDGTEAGTQMLLDLDGTAASSNVAILLPYDDRLLLSGAGGLWTSDGTTEGTTRIATVGSVRGAERIGSTVFFTATGPGTPGRQLWKTDGTEEGTVMLMDFAPGSISGAWFVTALTPVGSTLYVVARINSSTVQLWKTDGTIAGTELVKVFSTGGGSPRSVTLPDGLLYFEINGTIWRSDGTAAGTVPLVQNAYSLVSAFGRLYYVQGGTGTALWTSNGVTHSVVLSMTGSILDLTATGGKLYFNGRDQHGYEPWVSEDGTAATTHRLANVNPDQVPSSKPEGLTSDGDIVFFRADDGFSTKKLFRSDGTASGTFSLTNTDPRELTSRQGSAWFGDSGNGLWRSDGTIAGTAMMKDFSGGKPERLFPGSRYLYFAAGNTPQTWRAGETPSEVVSVSEGESLSSKILFNPFEFAELAGRVYVNSSANPQSIWVTEGDTATTARVFTVPSGNIANLTTAAGALYFSTSQTGPHVLWRSDGTFQNGVPVKDVAGNEVLKPAQLTASGRYLFCVAEDATHGAELWRSDGTDAGTFLVKDIAPGASGSSISSMTAAGELLYFVANDGTHGAELWRSDGTPDGTVMVADLRAGSTSSSPGSLEFAHGSLWFTADDGIAGRELWRIANDVPSMVADLAPGPGSSSPADIEQAGALLFFSAFTSVGRELWALPLDSSVMDIDDVRMTEGTGGTRTMRFTVTRSGDVAGAASVAFATGVGSASTSDYETLTGTLTFADGQTKQFIDVVVHSDAVIEGTESLFVTLSSPTNALLGKSVGTGIIDDDDRRAELSIAAIQTGSRHRSFQITNAGPSVATNLRLRFSESPGILIFNFSGLCSSKENPATCTLDPILPGGVATLLIQSSGRGGYFDPNAIAGATVTATITAAEIDSNPSDNTVSNMFSDLEGALMLPPFLTTNSTVTANAMPFSTEQYLTTVRLISSSSNVVVTPERIDLPQGETTATFQLAVGSLTDPAGLAMRLTGWPDSSLVIPVIAPGGTPKLDVAMIPPNTLRVDVGEAAEIEVAIAARKHDGTLPTGTVSLLDENLNVVAQQTLDSAAKAAMSINDLPVGRHTFVTRYHGDTNFNALDGPETLIIVDGLRTTVSVTAPPVVCLGTTHEVVATVRSTESSDAPTGSVRLFTTGGVSPTLALTPTGVPGESRASWTTSFGTGTNHAEYTPTGAFAASSGTKKSVAHACAGFGVQATATSATSVTLTWPPIAGSTRYHVHRFNSDLQWIMVGTVAPGTTRTETGLTPNRSYLYVVDYYSDTDYLGSSAPDVATTLLFDDDPIVARTTRVRASHIEQLRMAANALRWYGLTSDITDIAPMPVGSPIRAEHITALRTDINAQRRALGFPVIAFTDPVLAPGAPIKAVHIEELRNGVK